MNQRMALILAGGLTAFMLVVVGAVAALVLAKPAAVLNAQAPAAMQPVSANSVRLSADQAAQIALNAAPGATLTNTPDLVSFQGTVAFEVILNHGTIYVDANTGQVLYNGVAVSGSAPTGSTRNERHRDDESEQLFGGHDD
jgi:hypothetical protein